jgi:uncharacterized membrane protein
MADTMDFPLTRQGVRDLDSPRRASNVNVGSGEHAVSTMAAAVLAGVALRVGSLTGLLMGTAGATLAYRGVTRHCSVNAAIGKNTANRTTPYAC